MPGLCSVRTDPGAKRLRLRPWSLVPRKRLRRRPGIPGESLGKRCPTTVRKTTKAVAAEELTAELATWCGGVWQEALLQLGR